MIARIMRLLLLIQLGVAAFIAFALTHWYHFTPVSATIYGLLAIIVFRTLILVYGFAATYPYASRQPAIPRLGFFKSFKMIVEECAIALWSSVWSMPFRRFDKRITPNSTALPVLLLHGYVCNSGFWRPVSRVLRKAGISHYAIDIEPVFNSIDTNAAAVHAAVERIISECNTGHVVIIAHSMGGLVARAYLRDYGSHRVAKVITLGSPHHGTSVARRGIGVNCKEMLCSTADGQITESDWLQKMGVCENKATRELFVSVYSTHDNVIYPQASSYLEGANNIAVSGIGHMALCLQPEIQQRIVDEIHAVSPTKNPLL